MNDKTDWKEIAKTNTQKAWAETTKLSKRLKHDWAEFRQQQKHTKDTALETMNILTPRTLPKKCRLIRLSQKEVVFSFKAIRAQAWWLPILVFPTSVVFSGLLFALAGLQRSGQTEGLLGAFIISFIMISVCVVIYFITYPHVRVTATRDYIIFGDMPFSRKYYGGTNIGIQRQTPFAQFAHIWVDYGLWGEETSYMLESHKADKILTWINLMIESTSAPAESEHETDYGEREQAFE